MPIRLDETHLPGLRPTVGYVSLNSDEDTDEIADMIVAKIGRRNLISYPELSAKWVQNVLDVNRLWHIDCLAFCVDRRFPLHEDGFECRMGISYGINLTSPRSGWLAPPEQTGANVFGLHSLAIDGRDLCLTDRWYDSLPVDSFDRLEDAVAAAYTALAAIDDGA